LFFGRGSERMIPGTYADKRRWLRRRKEPCQRRLR
jgi:hypothetical protein